MEELRIKCPSCGIILDVINSKNEAVKRIVCPNCKKQLAVTFRDEPQAMEYVSIKMVQLADGSSKCLVRAMTDDHVIKVNGQQLLKDDEVVLAIGDELQIDDTVGIFGKEGHFAFQKPAKKSEPIQKSEPKTEQEQQSIPKSATKPAPVVESQSPVKSRSSWFMAIALISAFLFVFVVWMLWPFGEEKHSNIKNNTIDTVIAQKPVKPVTKPTVDKQDQVTRKQETSKGQPQSSMSEANDYELERLAISGDATAQYLLGRRWVNRRDSVNVVKGINYLRLAAQNGSSEARSTLRTVYAALEQSAAKGSSTAANILKEQR